MKFNMHDLAILVITFLATAAPQLIANSSHITQSVIISAISAGLVAVGHKYFPKETS